MAGCQLDLLTPGDVGALVRALQPAHEAPDVLRRTAARVRDRVAAHFRAEVMAGRVLEFYGETRRAALPINPNGELTHTAC